MAIWADPRRRDLLGGAHLSTDREMQRKPGFRPPRVMEFPAIGGTAQTAGTRVTVQNGRER
jgi:hypothetical protein